MKFVFSHDTGVIVVKTAYLTPVMLEFTWTQSRSNSFPSNLKRDLLHHCVSLVVDLESKHHLGAMGGTIQHKVSQRDGQPCHDVVVRVSGEYPALELLRNSLLRYVDGQPCIMTELSPVSRCPLSLASPAIAAVS